MSICSPCRAPHTAQACEDTRAGRRGTNRHCYCQHKPYPVVVGDSAPSQDPARDAAAGALRNHPEAP